MSTTVLVLLIYAIFCIPFVSTQMEVSSESPFGVELDEEEDSFDSLFVYTEMDQLDTGLRTEINETKELKNAFSWPNSTQAYILSSAGQVSCKYHFC